MKHPFLAVIAGLISLVCTSCLECREEFWLNADGSGRGEIRASIPKSILAMQGGEKAVGKLIDDFIKNTPEISGSTYLISQEGNRASISLNLAFQSAFDLADLPGSPSIETLPEAATHIVGDIQTKLQGRTIHVKRLVSLGKAIPGSALLPASTFEGRRLVSILHLPAPASDHNATRTENNGRTLIWDHSVSDAIRNPILSEFKMSIPIPWPLILSISIPLLLILLWLLALWKKRKTTHPSHPVKPQTQSASSHSRN